MRSWLVAAALLLAAGCATRPGLDTAPWPAELPDRVELAYVAFFPQDRWQCGPAALATVLEAGGFATSPDALVDEVYVPARRGSLQVEMLAAARKRGALVHRVRPRLDALARELAGGHPVLILQNLGVSAWPIWHYAVVIGYDRDDDSWLLRSGTRERHVLSSRRFAGAWARADGWGFVALPPGKLPAGGTPTSVVGAAADLESGGHVAAAMAAYESAARRWPDSALPRVAQANARLAAGDARGAEDALRDALEAAPHDAAARNNLAELLSRRGCRVAALAEITRARADAAGSALEPLVEETAREIGARAARSSPEDCPQQ